MPRVSDHQHYRRYCRLRQVWIDNQRLFGLLSPNEQWAIHDYYRPSHELTELELRAHRAEVAASQPSLPSRAGKAWALLERYRIGKQVPPRTKPGQLRVRAIVRPEIDLERLARVLVALARSGRI